MGTVTAHIVSVFLICMKNCFLTHDRLGILKTISHCNRDSYIAIAHTLRRFTRLTWSICFLCVFHKIAVEDSQLITRYSTLLNYKMLFLGTASLKRS